MSNGEIKEEIKDEISENAKDEVLEETKEEVLEDSNEEKKHDEESNDKKSNILKEIKSYCLIVIAAIIVAVFVNTFILTNTRIPTGSMENTINCEDRLFGNRLAYVFGDVKRGDIIIFKYPDDKSIKYIKRVIGLPGDTIKIESGILYINGKEYKEDYLKEPMQGDYGPVTVPDNSYFVMGDNRNNSKDARYWDNTFLDKKDIIAKAIIRYWPSIKIVK